MRNINAISVGTLPITQSIVANAYSKHVRYVLMSTDKLSSMNIAPKDVKLSQKRIWPS
jgi:hypothetical protein